MIKLIWRSYTTAKALPTTKQIKLINKKKFAKTALDKNLETFVIHMAFVNLVPGVYPNKKAQIAYLLTEKVRILKKYSDFINVFSKKKALVLPEQTAFNQHTIELEEGK